MAESSDGTHLVRRALSGLDPSVILEYVDTLDLSPRGGTNVIVLAPLRNLHRGRNVGAFVVSAPAPAVRYVGEVLSHAALDRVVELLGDDADEPSFDQLTAAIDEMLAGDFDAPTVALMLATAAANNVPAAVHCRALLEGRDDLRPPEVDAPAPVGILGVHEVDPKVKEQRRARREAQRRERAKAPSRPPSRPAKSRPEPPARASEPRVREPHAPLTRRAAILTPLEALEFSGLDPRRGEVIVVPVEHEPTPGQAPGEADKFRPALVVATSADAVLVRAIYSSPREGRVLLIGWNHAGLERPSYLGAERVRVALTAAGYPAALGRLSDEEWNASL